MAYGENKIYEDLDFEVQRGDRTALIGPNGAGNPRCSRSWRVKWRFSKAFAPKATTVVCYFSQHRSKTLDPNNTVLDEVLAASSEMRDDEARGLLGCFMFRGEEIYKKTNVLSGGEKSRLNLLKFLVNPPNLLLMDEPTTHLDLLTIESLILALERYEGTLLFISHDVYFIRRLATKILHVKHGRLTLYAGDYDYFLEKTHSEENDRAAITA